MTKMSYDEAVSFIHGRRKFTKDPSLVKMRRMAELMGNPQKKTEIDSRYGNERERVSDRISARVADVSRISRRDVHVSFYRQVQRASRN